MLGPPQRRPNHRARPSPGRRLDLEEAWRELAHFYGSHNAANDTEADEAPAAFLDVSAEHPLQEFERLCGRLLEWRDEIFAFHDTDRVSSGRIADTNNKTGVFKRVSPTGCESR